MSRIRDIQRRTLESFGARPRFTHRNGWVWRVPGASGSYGRNEAFQMVYEAFSPKDRRQIRQRLVDAV